MRVLIRTDSSTAIGLGHLSRCLTLAESLRDNGDDITFACRRLPGDNIAALRKKRFTVVTLPESPADDAASTLSLLPPNAGFDWIVVDHYDLDYQWETRMTDHGGQIMVIDDLARHNHNCHLLLDQNLVPDHKTRYDSLVPDSCRKLLGPTYALLRPEFEQARQNLRPRTGTILKILVSLGGGDYHHVTEMVLDAMETPLSSGLDVDVVVGASSKDYARLRARCDAEPRWTCLHDISDMAARMAAADLAIGSGGSTTWERCCLGLPALTVATTDDEIELASSPENFGFGRYLGFHSDLSAAKITEAIIYCLENPDRMRDWSRTALDLVDGKGAERVVRAMKEIHEMETIA